MYIRISVIHNNANVVSQSSQFQNCFDNSPWIKFFNIRKGKIIDNGIIFRANKKKVFSYKDADWGN